MYEGRGTIYRYELYLSTLCWVDTILWIARTVGHAPGCLHEDLNCCATTPNIKRPRRGIGERANELLLNVSCSSAISMIAGAFCPTETSQDLQKLDLWDLLAFLHAMQPFWPSLGTPGQVPLGQRLEGVTPRTHA